ncbi:4022_t:CDS:2, partial [Racocetra persica]
NDLELQNNIQNQAAYGFYQKTFEPELYNLENDGEFEDWSGNNNRLGNVNGLENRFECANEFENEFENGLDCDDEFEGIDEFENGLDCDDEFEGVDEFENGLDRNDEFEGIDEFENEMECDEFEGINESENGSVIDEFENWSESDSSDSSIASSTLIDNEENIPFISSELAAVIRLLKVKAQNNLTDEAFSEIMKAVITNPMSLYMIKKKLSSLVSFKPVWIDMCINTCCAYTGNYS